MKNLFVISKELPLPYNDIFNKLIENIREKIEHLETTQKKLESQIIYHQQKCKSLLREQTMISAKTEAGIIIVTRKHAEYLKGHIINLNSLLIEISFQYQNRKISDAISLLTNELIKQKKTYKQVIKSIVSDYEEDINIKWRPSGIDASSNEINQEIIKVKGMVFKNNMFDESLFKSVGFE